MLFLIPHVFLFSGVNSMNVMFASVTQSTYTVEHSLPLNAGV